MMRRCLVRRAVWPWGIALWLLAAGWCADVSAQMDPQTKLMARRGAKVDALRNLLEAVYGLRVDSRTTVRDFVTQSDVIRGRLSSAIQGAREVDYRVQPDGTAEVTVEVTLGRVQDILGRRLQYDEETIRATGYAAPSGQPVPMAPASGAVLRAKGHGVEPKEGDMTPAEKGLLAKRAAKLDALRNLAEQVNGVRISGETLVRDFVTRSDDLRSRVFSYIQGARVVSEYQLADGSYETVIEIDVEPLRGILGVR